MPGNFRPTLVNPVGLIGRHVGGEGGGEVDGLPRPSLGPGVELVAEVGQVGDLVLAAEPADHDQLLGTCGRRVGIISGALGIDFGREALAEKKR